MAISSQTYTGNNSVTTFPISFDWIYVSDIIVTVDSSVKVNGTDYTIVNKNVVFTEAPSTGVVVKIARSSNLTTRIVDFVNGSRLDESDLDNSAKQLFYLIQELKDQTDDVRTLSANAAALILPDTVGNTALQSGSVTNSKVANDAITNSKVANDAITNSKVANGAITAAKLSTGGPSWDTSGNVGIGTASPSGKLHVVGDIHATSDHASILAKGAIYPNVQLMNTAAPINKKYFRSAVVPNGNVVFERINDAYTTASTAVVIDGNNNVGIGTSSPSAKLSVYGAGQTTSSISTVSNLGCSVYVQDSGGASGHGGSIILGANQGAFAAIKALITDGAINTVGDLSFSTRNAVSDATLTERIRITATGTINTNANPIINCPTTAKAWVNFNGTTTFGAAIGVSYSRSGTTVTVTATAHGQSNGVSERIYNATDSGLNAAVTITVVNANTFTFQTTATGASTGTLSYAFNSIRSSYNVSSITKNDTGYYTISFATPMADANYSVSLASNETAFPDWPSVRLITQSTASIQVQVGNRYNGAFSDSSIYCVQVFGN